MATVRQLGLIPGLVLALSFVAPAQLEEAGRGDLSEATSIEVVDSAALNHLNRVNEYLANQQWANAVGTLRKVGEQYGDGLVKVEDRSVHGQNRLTAARYVSIRHHCQTRLAALPPEALRLYRDQVDAPARAAFEAASRSRDRRALRQLTSEFFCSSPGDDALLLLGDLSLESGDYAAARDAWQRITPIEAAGNFARIPKALFEKARKTPGPFSVELPLLEKWYRATDSPVAPTYDLTTETLPADDERRLARFWSWQGLIDALKYPDSTIELADVDARLVLASIMEGSADRAARELKQFTALHPEAEGQLGGKRVRYATALAELLAESAAWPQQATTTDWPTFAGSSDRNGLRPGEIDVQGKPWKIELPRPILPERENWQSFHSTTLKYRATRVAESHEKPLCFVPVIAQGKCFFCDETSVYAYSLKDGQPAFPSDGKPGMIYPLRAEEGAVPISRQPFAGTPRFTLTVSGDKLFARLGTPITNAANAVLMPRGTTRIVCLDLANPGRVAWEAAGEAEWAFEGSPVTDGLRVFAAQRQRGASARARVVAYDAETGRLLWQRFLCAAQTVSRGEADECTSNLLTLHQGIVYCNTNLGAVAALDAQDGVIQWLTTYPRAKVTAGSAPAFFYRDLNPCLYHNGMVYAAPSDYDGILAIRAATGQIVGAMLEESAEKSASKQKGATAVHLLGAVGDYLIASGDMLWWFDVRRALLGEVGRGDAFDLPDAYGRGVIVGDKVYIPLRDRIEVFEARQPGQKAPHPIALSALHSEVTGGHLVVSDTHLLVAGHETIWGFELSRPLSSYRAAPAKAAPAPGGSR
jgi:hypothetical protein